VCACKFHNRDCYNKISKFAADAGATADARALAAACPRCARLCACGGGTFVCHAAKIRTKRNNSPTEPLQRPEAATTRPGAAPPPLRQQPEWTRERIVALHWGVTKHGEDFETVRARDRRLAGFDVGALRAEWRRLKPTLTFRR